MSSEQLRSHILGELSKLPKKKVGRNGAQVLCPFHNDRTPSGGINLDETERKAPLGWFRCFGCQTSVNWNSYAEMVGLLPFKKKPKESSSDYMDLKRVADELLPEGDDEAEQEFSYELSKLKFKKFKATEWRGVPVDFLKKIGCRYAYSSYFKEYYVWMPVFIGGGLKGYVKARIEKPTDGSPSYINAKGSWSEAFGLLFFDYAVELMKRKGLRTLVLCEGPRDVIRLLRNGIPACAVLGASNWGDSKRFLLETVSGLERVILFMDGDDAGIAATKLIRKNLKGHFETKYMALWKHRVPKLDKKGKQAYKLLGQGDTKTKKLLWENELDPFTAPKKFITQVKTALV